MGEHYGCKNFFGQTAWWVWSEADEIKFGSADAELKNFTGQRLESISSVKKLRLLIYKGGVYKGGDKKKQPTNITLTLTQTALSDCITLHVGKQGACSAEVGIVALRIKKSATELKYKPKLPRFKNTVHIATFNVTWADSVW